MASIEKTIRNEIRKWISIDLDIYFIKEAIKDCYYKISLGEYDSKKKVFYKIALSKNEKRLHLP